MPDLSAILILALALVGTGASIFGSIVGLGGGFIAVPTLRVFFHFSPGLAAATSLVLVFANTAGATVSFARQGRVAFDLALPVATAAIPASIAGAFVSTRLPPAIFDKLFAFLMAGIAIDVLLRLRTVRAVEIPGRSRRRSVLGWILCGLVVGFVSSLFGIGGGIVAVPMLLYFTVKPLEVVTATSTAIIAFTAPVGIVAHAFAHDIAWVPALALGCGALAGGQIGAYLAQFISTRQLGALLAIAMFAAAAAMGLRNVL
ncbi:MAG: hypothetical protein DLM50_07770 [Candidatus Meridianibacter frigidus]|nr:MAG: hypothetical protein DLM50_07770 [Candidatus Eremiobacteraeota bacterium]